jgi:hypothetical protein
MDNYGTHKHEKVRHFLDRHRRFKIHYIPTSSSWLNLVERWFAELSGKAVQRGSFASVPDLIQAIFDFIAQWNAEPTHAVGGSFCPCHPTAISGGRGSQSCPECKRGFPESPLGNIAANCRSLSIKRGAANCL